MERSIYQPRPAPPKHLVVDARPRRHQNGKSSPTITGTRKPIWRWPRFHLIAVLLGVGVSMVCWWREPKKTSLHRPGRGPAHRSRKALDQSRRSPGVNLRRSASVQPTRRRNRVLEGAKICPRDVPTTRFKRPQTKALEAENRGRAKARQATSGISKNTKPRRNPKPA